MEFEINKRNAIYSMSFSYFFFFFLLVIPNGYTSSIRIENVDTDHYFVKFEPMIFTRETDNSTLWITDKEHPLLLKLVDKSSPQKSFVVKPSIKSNKLVFDCNQRAGSEINIFFRFYNADKPDNLTIESYADSITKESFTIGTNVEATDMKIVKSADGKDFYINLNKQPKDLVLYNIRQESFELNANIEALRDNSLYIQTFSYQNTQRDFSCKIIGWRVLKLENVHQYVIQLSKKNSKPDHVLGINSNHNRDFQLKFRYTHDHSQSPIIKIPLNHTMFYLEKAGCTQASAKSYSFVENEVGEPTITLSFDEPICMEVETNFEAAEDHNETNTEVEEIEPETTINKYGITFTQATNTNLTFEGFINENEWTAYTQTEKLCAKLLTINIYIKKENQNLIKKQFKGFQDKNYLLSTENQYENQKQGEAILICLDKNDNPGSLTIKKRITLTETNKVYEFLKDDFIFLHDENIKVVDIQKDFIKDVPSLLLELDNTHGIIKYNQCVICFNQCRNWKLKSNGEDDGIWTAWGKNYWRTFLSSFKVVGNQQPTVNRLQYDSVNNRFKLNIPGNNKNGVRIEIYTESPTQPSQLTFVANEHINQQGECIPFKNEYFDFPSNPFLEVTNIDYNFRDNRFKPRPTIRIDIGQKRVADNHIDDDYTLFFHSVGNYRISKNIDNWRECGENYPDNQCFEIETLTVNSIPSPCLGDIVDGQYQIQIGQSSMTTGIPLLIYINKIEDFTPNIRLNVELDVFANESKSITAGSFSIQNDNYQIRNITSNYNRNHPSIFLRIEPTPEMNLGILSFSDNMISDEILQELGSDYIANIETHCQSQLLAHAEQSITVVIVDYPSHIDPFSIDSIEVPKPTIEPDLRNDPETILRCINAQSELYQTLIIGHIEENLIDNQLILCFRGFISNLDNSLSVKRKLIINSNIGEQARSTIDEMILELLNRLRQFHPINQQFEISGDSCNKILIPPEKDIITPETLNIEFDPQIYANLNTIYDQNNLNHYFYSLHNDNSSPDAATSIRDNCQWQNTFIRKTDVNSGLFNSLVYSKLDSRNTSTNTMKTYYVLKATNEPVELTQANRIVNDKNNRNIASINTWKIPNVHELTHVFQFVEYTETVSNHIQEFMFSYKNQQALSFWTSSFQNQEKKVLWKVTFFFRNVYSRNPYFLMDYILEYYPIQSNEKAYLLPIAVPGQQQ